MVRWLRDNQYLIRAMIWVALVPVTILWLKDSILWVAMMSLYANIETALGAHEARKARKEQQE